MTDVSSHGYSSNGLSKINDKLVCSAGKYNLHIICVEPLQIIQKIHIHNSIIFFNYITKDNYMYIHGKDSIIQNKIIKDEDNNFVELIKNGKYSIDRFDSFNNESILPCDDGRIFVVISKNRHCYIQLIA